MQTASEVEVNVLPPLDGLGSRGLIVRRNEDLRLDVHQLSAVEDDFDFIGQEEDAVNAREVFAYFFYCVPLRRLEQVAQHNLGEMRSWLGRIEAHLEFFNIIVDDLVYIEIDRTFH